MPRISRFASTVTCLLVAGGVAASVYSAPVTNSVAPDRDYEAGEIPQSPAASARGMRLPADLALDLLMAEPAVQQPVFLNFDARGRMWVVEYRQYPDPAGLNIVSRDRFWRNIYDKKPLPPGHPDFVPGLDRISIHEDTNGDGHFDHSKTFVDGLSLATSCLTGDGGVWVLNPPYLLFYPDADGDDIPDSAPEVHLDGFGIQDSHAVVNSLCWGPDGWLYAAQGSTVTSDITVTGSDAPPESRIGQLIWRYHPGQKHYEVFAEGGGNMWSCEFDTSGRLLTGTNDKFPAYFYLQGAFYKKNFGKHGALSNPHAYDYFDGIDAPGHRRISNSILVYEGAALPERYNHALLFLGALQGTVGAYQLSPHDLNYQARALDLLLDATDRWFRPVYMESGPDGAIYLCDWYDQQINHYLNHQGKISKFDGRLFRIRDRDAQPQAPFDLNQRSTAELVDLFEHPNRWWRETAQTLLSWRDDRHSVAPRLRRLLADTEGQSALEALWALNRIDAFDHPSFDIAIAHPNPFVRQWAVRLIGDRRSGQPQTIAAISALAARETNLEVLGQIASSAARLPVDQALAVFKSLLRNDYTSSSNHLQSMIWWGIEPFYTAHPDPVASLFHRYIETDDDASPLLAGYMMRRMASAGTASDLAHCAQLVRLAPTTRLRSQIINGFEEAFKGRAMSALPSDLVSALVQSGLSPISLRMRLDPAGTQAEALQILASTDADTETIERVLEVLAESADPTALPGILERLKDPRPAVQLSALASLQGYTSPAIAQTVVDHLPHFSGQVAEAAETLLTSRLAWSQLWLKSASGPISANALDAMRRHDDALLNAQIDRQFGAIGTSGTTGYQSEIERVTTILATPGGDPRAGLALYQQRCAACHTLFDSGGQLGPELTSYQRDQTATLLLSIINPSAEIRAGYELVTVKTTDERTLSGFLSRNEAKMISLRVIGGAEIIIARDQVTSITPQPNSLMPAGLLRGLTDPELRDLFSYLRSPQPLSIN